MVLHEMLIENLKKSFEIKHVIKGICTEINNRIRNKLLLKFQNIEISKENLTFELYDIKTIFYACDFDTEDINQSKFYAFLLFTAKNKLPKEKNEKLNKIKKEFKKHHHISEDKSKVKFYYRLEYEFNYQDILSENYNFDVNLD